MWDSASELDSEQSFLGDQGSAVPLGAHDQCRGDVCRGITKDLPLEGTERLFGAAGSGSYAPSLAWGGGAMHLISSLAASDVPGVEGNCKSSSINSLGGESRDARLNRPLARAGVDGIVATGVEVEWPDVDHTPLKPLRPDVLDVGECPLSAFICFSHGPWDCERCRALEVSLDASDASWCRDSLELKSFLSIKSPTDASAL